MAIIRNDLLCGMRPPPSERSLNNNRPANARHNYASTKLLLSERAGTACQRPDGGVSSANESPLSASRRRSSQVRASRRPICWARRCRRWAMESVASGSTTSVRSSILDFSFVMRFSFQLRIKRARCGSELLYRAYFMENVVIGRNGRHSISVRRWFIPPFIEYEVNNG